MPRPKEPPSSRAPGPVEPTEPVDAPRKGAHSDLERDARSFVEAMLYMRELVAKIHAGHSSEQDGTSAVGIFARALLRVGGRLPGFPPNPWPLKHLLDAPTYPSVDPDRNHATKALTAFLFDCLEEGRVRPDAGEEELERFARHWTKFRTRAEAVSFEETHARDAHAARERAATDEHFQRLAQPHVAAARRRDVEPPEPVEPPEVTVG
jgi:hypothetical protein